MPDKILVRCKRTARLGRIDGFVDPPRRGGRDLRVLWQGGLEYSVVSREELELAPDATLEEWERQPVSRWEGDGSARGGDPPEPSARDV